MMRKIIFFLIIIELIIIAIIGLNIYLDKRKIFGVSSVNPINKANVANNLSTSLKYFYEPSPARTQTEHLSWLSYQPQITINYETLNERFDYSVNKTNVYRIVTLGDSFTYGSHVTTKENWTEQLEDLLNVKLNCKSKQKFEVINFGVPGYDIQYSVERYKLRGQKYNPDLILWFLKDDDFNQINEYIIPKEKEVAIEMGFDKDSIDYFFHNGKTYPSWQKASEIMEQELSKEKISLFQKNALEEFNKYYQNQLLLLTFSFTNNEYQLIMKNFIGSIKNSFYYNQIPNIYKLGVSLLDGHPNKEGHIIIAQDLFDYLIKNKIIQCK